MTERAEATANVVIFSPHSKSPTDPDEKPEGIESRIRIGRAAVGVMLEHRAEAHGPVLCDDARDAELAEPVEREILTHAAGDALRIHPAKASARAAEDAPCAARIPPFDGG